MRLTEWNRKTCFVFKGEINLNMRTIKKQETLLLKKMTIPMYLNVFWILLLWKLNFPHVLKEQDIITHYNRTYLSIFLMKNLKLTKNIEFYLHTVSCIFMTVKHVILYSCEWLPALSLRIQLIKISVISVCYMTDNTDTQDRVPVAIGTGNISWSMIILKVSYERGYAFFTWLGV